MSDRDPESDWDPPPTEYSRGGGHHYSGNLRPEDRGSFNAASPARSDGVNLPAVVMIVIGIAFIVGVFLVLATK